MSARFDIQARWPELFAGLSDVQRRSVVNTLASSWHEGWEPNRAEVAVFTDFVRGDIDEAEYDRRMEALSTGSAAHAAS